MVSYQYPVKGGTEEWKKFTSHAEMLEVSQVPKTILEKMTTAELVETVLNYPLYGDMYAYDTFQQGIESISTQFNGLSELLKRNDAGIVLLAKYKEKKPLEVINLTTDLEKGNFSMNLGFLETILSHDKVISGLNKAQKQDLLEVAKQKKQQKLVQEDVFGLTSLGTSKNLIDKVTAVIFKINSVVFATVKTPIGTPVEVFTDSRVKTSVEKQWDANHVSTFYPQATIVSESSYKYNCHSYAWYQSSPMNPYWMNYPDAYMNDGSYVYKGLNPGTYSSGLKMYYPGLHSAVMNSKTSNNYSDITATSKWGNLPLMRHKANYCPYNSSNILFY